THSAAAARPWSQRRRWGAGTSGSTSTRAIVKSRATGSARDRPRVCQRPAGARSRATGSARDGPRVCQRPAWARSRATGSTRPWASGAPAFGVGQVARHGQRAPCLGPLSAGSIARLGQGAAGVSGAPALDQADRLVALGLDLVPVDGAAL